MIDKTLFTKKPLTAERSQVQCLTVGNSWQEGKGGSGKFFASTRREVGGWGQGCRGEKGKSYVCFFVLFYVLFWCSIVDRNIVRFFLNVDNAIEPRIIN